ncbi:GNAT family N-acetyltransferase [bacterium]|nr:GNAT family N-acetyltransferase [bacterium]
MSWTIRDFVDADFEAWAELHNAVFPDWTESAAERRRADRLREPQHKVRRWVAEGGAALLGTGCYYQETWGYHPRKFYVEVIVREDRRRQGLGAALYDTVVAALAEHEPILLRGMLREDWEASRRFAAARGYAPGMRVEESVCDIASFDPSAYAADLARASEQGIAIRSLPELENRPDWQEKMYALAQQLLADMPRTELHVPPPFELWRERSLGSPRFLPELNLIALDGERFVGISNFWRNEIPGRVGTGLTGVLGEYRRRGLATALKVRALGAAKAAGYKETRTWNAAENAGMLGINRRLGFTPLPAWLEMEKPVGADEGEAARA